MEKPRLSKEAFLGLRDLIYERWGICFQENKAYLLEDRLKKRLEKRGLSSFDEYLYFLRYDPLREKELRDLVESITTNETSFFRDMNQLEAFRKGVLPEVMKRKENGQRHLRIWSAGCSTGEEPYTIAMIVHDEGLPAKGYRVDILGTDVSERVLDVARRGIYGEYAVRNAPDRYLKRYFTMEKEGYMVKEEIKRMVRFQNINLVDHSQMKRVRGMDVIFCRNVLIYFDDEAKRRVVGYLYDSLVDGGFLIVGFSESLFNITRAFKPIGINRCIVYQKV